MNLQVKFQPQTPDSKAGGLDDDDEGNPFRQIATAEGHRHIAVPIPRLHG